MTNASWLEAIGRHAETTTVDLLAAYSGLGVETECTPEQIDRSTVWLTVLGFLKVVDMSPDGRTFTYERQIPVAA
ncbi:hypothetical protein MMUR_47860 [Mycolicibacterium murale]|uniref:Uncharacterized protein n=1 Tax=Mycolicibacterium murale TaxID=182220 RepID=A0A7I9WTE6_9MYCO|nr:hypothetical protein [Mycolicibacterium murale]MCV7186408.1 hypothetical protein [Mycolicibacterium murale]GFG60650.1 hypothetical protein MMUR_47860 [Mycolicibacterium murale]